LTTLLSELTKLLSWHADKKREAVESFFNRQLHERIHGHGLSRPIPGWRLVQLSHDQVHVLEERWPLEKLLEFPSWHDRAKPTVGDAPLILFRGWGQLRLIDGFNRINHWRHTSNAGPHRVLAVEPLMDVRDPFPLPPR
jgi:hypothetical protein